jgi:hypothetical protein
MFKIAASVILLALSSAQAALAALISGLMRPLAQARQASNPEAFLSSLIARLSDSSQYAYDRDQLYKVSFGHTEADRMGKFGRDWVSFNSAGVGRWLDWIARAKLGETRPSEDYEVRPARRKLTTRLSLSACAQASSNWPPCK